MLKIGKLEKEILDGLLETTPKKLAERMEIDVQKIYNTKSYFKRKVQNAGDFLAVAKSKYKPLLVKRLKTPKIMPPEDDYSDEWWLTAKKIVSWRKLTNRIDVDEALERGSVVGTMAVHQSFLHYKSGVYHSLGVGDPIVGYHAIGIVGCDEGKNADLLRNSWGTDWGMDGYCWIQQGDSELEYYELVINGEVEPEPEPEKPWWQLLIEWILDFIDNIISRRK